MKKRLISTILHLFSSATIVCITLTSQTLFAQGVGINTTTPDPSAALDIQSYNKGILIPHVYLTDISDKTTIPSPATGLLIFNTNKTAPSLTGEGFYYNSGTINLPNWTNINQFQIPYYIATESNKNIFHIENYGGTASTSSIKGYSAGDGTGIYAQNDGNGNALIVDGKLKIIGNSQAPAAGKLLTSDNNGNATWQEQSVKNKTTFKASGIKGGGSEKIANNTTTKIPFATEDFDPGFNYSPVNGNPHSTFIAPVNGIYHFDLKLGVEASVKIGLSLNKESVSGLTVEASEFAEDPQLSINLKLNAGDKIFATVFQSTGDYVFLSIPNTASYFTGYLISEL